MSATVCVEAGRVREAVRLFLSKEISSSSLPSFPSDLKIHLSACAACARVAAALDPTLVFVTLAASVSPEPASTGRRPAPPVVEDARRVADAVLDEVRHRARVSSPAAPARRPFFSRRFAQAAAILTFAAGLAGLVRWEQKRPTLVAAVKPEPVVPADAEAAPARPLIEGMRSPNARVYEFAAASPREPAVVFVANPNADL